MFLQRYVYRVSITEQTRANVVYLFQDIIKVENFAKQSFVVRRKHFRALFDVITIYTKQRTPLPAENS